MSNVEYLFQTSRRGFADAPAERQPFRGRIERRRIAELDGGPDVIAGQDLCKVVATFDGRDDRQASAQVIDRLRREAEARHAGNGGYHPHVAGAEQLEIVGASHGWSVEEVCLGFRACPNGGSEPSLAHEQKRQRRPSSRCSGGGSEHLFKAAAFDQLSAKYGHGGAAR